MEKPTPKTQREISISLQQPYEQQGPGFQPIGNPNPEFIKNRADQISFKDDTTKPFSIGIQDIDEAVMYYFKEVIKPFVIQNGERIAVPIIYASPEKWSSFQKDGYYRDAKGKIMYPIIVFKRDSIEKDRTTGNKLDANQPVNYGIFYKQYTPDNAYDNFSVLNNRKPTKTYYATVIPDYLTVKYSCIIFTYYVEQLNKIVEAIEYASDSYWGNPEKFKFRTKIDSFNTAVELQNEDERIVKCTFDIQLRGHIIPDVPQKDLNAIKKFRNSSKINIISETTTDL
jgi:hypothetical protein